SACSENNLSTGKRLSSQNPILLEREARDAAFKSDGNSPILPQDRPKFKGLAYYPINPDLRFSARLNRYPSPKQIKLGTNTGEIRSGLRYGYFDFQVGAQNCRLQVYRLEDVPESGGSNLFIPFRDATSGKETYAAGRYIDLTENTSGIYDLDFNRAYNPFCAYNSEFSCPVPPAENTLAVPIRAGEKKYSTGENPIGFWLFAPGDQCYYVFYQPPRGELCRQFLQILENC
ncbi:MAG: DUF1684 domain-containing protein, partial [Methanomicrobiales archaeon]|nr:DUF1684 domain-containing protein [Methanomicrobiales archaeon]